MCRGGGVDAGIGLEGLKPFCRFGHARRDRRRVCLAIASEWDLER